MDTIIALGIVVVLAIVALVIGFWYYVFGNSYARAIDKAIKDMEKGITTVITEDENCNFYVKKYKDGKKL